jgi:hypothetical protein
MKPIACIFYELHAFGRASENKANVGHHREGRYGESGEAHQKPRTRYSSPRNRAL